MKIGRFELSLIEVPEGKNPPYTPTEHVWILRDDGEGMSIRTAVLEETIAKFYAEHF
jgi:hypothetical protein